MNFHATKRHIFKTFKAFIALGLSALGALPVAAQSWPDKPTNLCGWSCRRRPAVRWM